MRALWLTSWYPNLTDKFNGDFIQRHAYATSQFCNIDVIHVEAVAANSIKNPVLIQTSEQKNLTETIILYKQSKLPVIGKIITYKKYFRLFKKQVQAYIHANGKPDIIHVHVTMKAGLIALWLKQKFGIPYIITEHWSLFVNNPKDAFQNRNSIFKTSAKRVFKNAALVLPVNIKLGEAINAITPVRFTVIYNCVNTDYFFYDASIKNDAFTFIHVSTLDPNKNPQNIVEAFINFHNHFPLSKLIIAGQITNEFSNYLSKIKFPANAIEFSGLIAYKNVAELMQRSNSFILFSRTENMPCVMLEALCCGLPIISSDVGGIHEILNKENGLFVPDYSTASLLQTMIKMYNDFHFYNRKKIAADAQKNFSYNTIGHEIFLKYKEVCN